jgi:hypothetical protein
MITAETQRRRDNQKIIPVTRAASDSLNVFSGSLRLGGESGFPWKN